MLLTRLQLRDDVKPVPTQAIEDFLQPKQMKVQFAYDTSSPPLKRTSAQLLESVLNERPHLNLSGKVAVDDKAVSLAFGGFADVYKGFYMEGAKHVAVKRLRLNIRASEKVTKVCTTMP